MLVLQATRETAYLDAGAAIIQSLYDLNWVDGGWASVQSVHSRQLEDHMPSYFLAEACKYLYLLFDDSFLQVTPSASSHKPQESLDHCREAFLLKKISRQKAKATPLGIITGGFVPRSSPRSVTLVPSILHSMDHAVQPSLFPYAYIVQTRVKRYHWC